MKTLLLHFKLQRRRKGSASWILRMTVILLFMIIVFLAVVPMVVSGAESAARTAQSCPAWMSKISDMSTGAIQLC